MATNHRYRDIDFTLPGAIGDLKRCRDHCKAEPQCVLGMFGWKEGRKNRCWRKRADTTEVSNEYFTGIKFQCGKHNMRQSIFMIRLRVHPHYSNHIKKTLLAKQSPEVEFQKVKIGLI